MWAALWDHEVTPAAPWISLWGKGPLYARDGTLLFLLDLSLVRVPEGMLQCPAGPSEDLDGAPIHYAHSRETKQWHSLFPLAFGCSLSSHRALVVPRPSPWSHCLLLVVQRLLNLLPVVTQKNLL